MSKPKQPSRLRISRSARASDGTRFVMPAVVLAALLAGGCASDSGEAQSGMRTWVDERGQVRYSPAPATGSEQSGDGDQGETPDSGADNPATEDDPAHPLFNLQNFPDASNQSPDKERLFYSWRDAEGRVFNTPYLYEEESMGRVMREREAEDASEARVTTRETNAAPGFRADSRAAAVLGLGEGSRNRLDAFAERCCEGLPRLEYYELTPERRLSVGIDEDTAVHRFSSGRSRFALVRLPGDGAHSLLRVRSYIREGGFFFPNAVFLDGGFQPLRLVTDLVLEYSPETWRRYGYMEARLPLRPDSGERWVVLFSRAADLETSTAVGGEGRRTRLNHREQGSLALGLTE